MARFGDRVVVLSDEAEDFLETWVLLLNGYPHGKRQVGMIDHLDIQPGYLQNQIQIAHRIDVFHLMNDDDCIIVCLQV